MSRNHAWAYPTFLFLVAILLPTNSWAQSNFNPSEKKSDGATMYDVDPAALSLSHTNPSNWVDLNESEVKKLFPSFGVSHRSNSDLYKLNFALPKSWVDGHYVQVRKVVDKARGISGFRIQIKAGLTLSDEVIAKAIKDCEGPQKRELCVSSREAFRDDTIINHATEGFKGKLGLLQYVHNWGDGQLYHYGVGQDNIEVLTAAEKELDAARTLRKSREKADAHNRAIVEACLEEGDHARAVELAEEFGIKLGGDLAEKMEEARVEAAKKDVEEKVRKLEEYISKRGKYATLRSIFAKIDSLARDIRDIDVDPDSETTLYDEYKDQLDTLKISSIEVALKNAKSANEVRSIQRFAVSKAASYREGAVKDAIAKISSKSLATYMKKCGHKSECYDEGKELLQDTARRLGNRIDESELAKLQAGEDKLEQAEFLTAYVRQDPRYFQRGMFSGSLFDERAEQLQTSVLENCYGYSSTSFLIFSFYSYDMPSRDDDNFDDMMHQCGRSKSKLQAFARIPYEAMAMRQRMSTMGNGVNFPNGVTSIAGLPGARGQASLIPGQLPQTNYSPFIMPNQASMPMAYNPQMGMYPQQQYGMYPQQQYGMPQYQQPGMYGQAYNPQLGLYPQTGAYGQPQYGYGYQPQLLAQNNGLPSLTPQMTQPGMSGSNPYLGRFFNPQTGGRMGLTLTDPAFIRNTGRSSLFNFGPQSPLFPRMI